MHVNTLRILDVQQLVRDYDIGHFISLDELSPGYANRSFKLETGQGIYLLRWVLEKDMVDLELELLLLNHLKAKDFPTSYPIAKLDGGFVTSYDPGHIVIYDYLSGKHPGLSSEVASEIGSAMGKLSAIIPPDNFHRSNSINITKCLELSSQLVNAPVQLPEIFDYFIKTTELIEGRLNIELPLGLVHADVFPDNTLFGQDGLQGIIDFEEICIDELLFDLAMTINGFCFPDEQLSAEHLTSLIQSYHKERSLSPGEWEAIPLYIAWTAHGMLSWHLERLSQKHLVRQEARVRVLMNRVLKVLKGEEGLSHLVGKIRLAL